MVPPKPRHKYHIFGSSIFIPSASFAYSPRSAVYPQRYFGGQGFVNPLETTCDVYATLAKFAAIPDLLSLTVRSHSGLINPRARGGDYVGPAVFVIQASGAYLRISSWGK
jgi:hypothetical protein